MRIVLAVEYDGRAFSGWQIQPSVLTVQAELERAVSKMAGEPVRIHAAGRTDAGVHASRQIVHFDTDVQRPLTAWVRGVNSFLPAGVSVLWSKAVSPDFHARFSAEARYYRYLLLVHPVRPSLWAGKIGWVHQPLDATQMAVAAETLLGEHDFSSFRAAECQAKTPVKFMQDIRIQQSGSLLVFDFCASAFLHHMVRNIMGALIHVGKGNQPSDWMKELLESKNRELAPPTFMPDGLYLSGVKYPSIYRLDSEPERRYEWI